MEMLSMPWAYDVLVMENMFGDILSDLGAGASNVLSERKDLTPDLGGSAGTDGVAAAVIAALGQGF